MTFESVLKEADFANINGIWWLQKYHITITVRIIKNQCDVAINSNSILLGYIYRPERLKVLLDILLEQR